LFISLLVGLRCAGADAGDGVAGGVSNTGAPIEDFIVIQLSFRAI